MWDEDYVVEVPNLSTISEKDGGLHVTAADGTSNLYASSACPPRGPTRRSDAGLVTVFGGDAHGSRGTLPDTCGSFSNNGWINNVYHWMAQPFDWFNASYVIPPRGPAADAKQSLYYFIGAVPGAKGDGPENILQPVLSYWGAQHHWSIASWDCCLAGRVAHAPYISGFGPGDRVSAAVGRANGTAWVVESSWQGKHSTLYVDRSYNGSDMQWPALDVTLEVWGVDACAMLTPELYVDRLSVSLTDGSAAALDWVSTLPTDTCGGYADAVNSSTVVFRSNPWAVNPPPALQSETFQGHGQYASLGGAHLTGLDLPDWHTAGPLIGQHLAGAGLGGFAGALNLSVGKLLPWYPPPAIMRRLPTAGFSLDMVFVAPASAGHGQVVFSIAETENVTWSQPTTHLQVTFSGGALEVGVFLTNGSHPLAKPYYPVYSNASAVPSGSGADRAINLSLSLPRDLASGWAISWGPEGGPRTQADLVQKNAEQYL
eukprot:gene1254-2708_t